MTTPCKIIRTLKGPAEKNYYLIKYIKSELEKRGLNPKIHLVLSDEERINLFKFPNMILDINPSFPAIPSFFNNFINPINIIFGIGNNGEKLNLDPDAIENPYLKFKNSLDGRLKGGGDRSLSIPYKSVGVKIEITF
jgi:hypothetical protein